MIKKNKLLFFGKPIFNKGTSGYICFSGKKVGVKKPDNLVSGYYFRFWGSKTWRFLSLKMIVFLANNYIDNQDYGEIK